jgi:hypothetical protein
MLRLCWNKQDPNYLATTMMDSNKVIVLDIRYIVVVAIVIVVTNRMPFCFCFVFVFKNLFPFFFILGWLKHLLPN